MLPDEIKAEFQKHISMHESALQQKMMEQAMQAQVAEQSQAALPGAATSPDQTGMTADQLQ
jgi:hypothetical protein